MNDSIINLKRKVCAALVALSPRAPVAKTYGGAHGVSVGDGDGSDEGSAVGTRVS